MTNPPLNVDNLYCLFERQANKTPEKVAVIDLEGETNYQNLRIQSESVHLALVAHGIARGCVVAIMMERSADLLAVALGILRAGCAFVSLDPNDPPQRLADMISRCNAAVLFADVPISLVQFVTTEVQNLTIIDLKNLRSTQSTAVPQIESGTDGLAYLLFTSGTTGEPKAVMVSQSNVIHLLLSAERLLNIASTDRYLAVSTVAFDASIIEFFLPLVTGASLLLRDGNLLLSPNKLANEIRVNCVTIMQTSPSVWAMVLRKSDNFPKLRVAITHGEAAPTDLADKLVDISETAFNMYGPTETTVWATGCQLTTSRTGLDRTTSAPIGRPLDHVRAFVVDTSGQVLEDEAEGELWLGGLGVSLGYWGDEAQTTIKYQQLNSDRVYKTGDRVSQSNDGTLHFLGRFDDQVQLSGVRVEPQEIEAVARDHPDVDTAIVTWFDGLPKGRQLLVAVVPKSDKTPTEDDIHGFLANHIPRRMMPSCILILSDVPLTPNGKISKTELRKSAVLRGSGRMASVRQISAYDYQSSTEREVAECWQRVLATNVTSRDQQFFLIGGDSLSAVYMISEIEMNYGIELQVNSVFENPTVRTFARHVETIQFNANSTRGQEFVVPIGQPDPLVTPLFFLNVDLCVARKGVWATDIPLYAVMYWSTQEGVARADSIEELATLFLSQIIEVQSTGPFRLGGYSFGGLLAFEIARQLKSAGEEVEFLFLLDPTPPGAPSQDLLPQKPAIGRVKSIFLGPTQLGWVAWVRTLVPLPYGAQKWIKDKSKIMTLVYNMVDWRVRNPNRFTWLPIPLHLWQAYAHFARPLIAEYQPEPYVGRTLIVNCTDGHGGGSAYKALLQGDVERLSLDTDHTLLFREPDLGTWMRWLAHRTQKHIQ